MLNVHLNEYLNTNVNTVLYYATYSAENWNVSPKTLYITWELEYAPGQKYFVFYITKTARFSSKSSKCQPDVFSRLSLYFVTLLILSFEDRTIGFVASLVQETSAIFFSFRCDSSCSRFNVISHCSSDKFGSARNESRNGERSQWQ